MTISLLNNAGTASSFLPKENTDGYYDKQTEVGSDVWRQQSPSVHTNLTYYIVFLLKPVTILNVKLCSHVCNVIPENIIGIISCNV